MVKNAKIKFKGKSPVTKVTFARQHLNECLRQWEQTSGRHLQLLQRRESWTTEDAHTFANLQSKILDVSDTTNENVTSSESCDEIERQEELLWEAEDELCSQLKKLEQSRGVGANPPTQWKERVLWEWEYIQAATSNTALEQLGVKTHQIVASFPSLEDMPKSPSEVHVPSAIVGASLTGAAVLLVMLIFTPKNR